MLIKTGCSKDLKLNIDCLRPLYPEYSQLLINMKKTIKDIYFSEVNIKYISLNVLKILVISRVRSTSKIADIFNTLDETIIGIYRKQLKFLFIFSVNGKTFCIVIAR